MNRYILELDTQDPVREIYADTCEEIDGWINFKVHPAVGGPARIKVRFRLDRVISVQTGD